MRDRLASFASECSAVLKADSGPAGRRKVGVLLESVLTDPDFVATYLPENGPARRILYEDPELGFCIVAHVNNDAKGSDPHDHGHSWAIYGQAHGETVMTDWEKLEQASADKPGKVRALQSYTLAPGIQRLYNEGDLHSPYRSGPTRLIRIEGTNMDKVKRFKYEEAAHATART